MHGFPAALTSFIGRDEPLREVAGLLAEHRLVTVTGPGGAGKTRLADQVARKVAGRFADGAWLAELAPVREAAQVASVVAHLVDCSLLSPPRAGADGRLRYSMLETLRGYGAARLAEAGEQDMSLIHI